MAHKKNILFLLATLIFLCGGTALWAATYTWNGTTSSDWKDASNWDSNSFPGTEVQTGNLQISSGENIIIKSGCTYYPKYEGIIAIGDASLEIKKGASLDVTEIQISNKLTNSGQLNVTTINILSNGGDVTNTGTIEGTTLTNNGKVNNTGGTIKTSTLTNHGSISNDTKGQITSTNITNEIGSNLTNTSGNINSQTITNKGTVDNSDNISSPTFENQGGSTSNKGTIQTDSNNANTDPNGKPSKPLATKELIIKDASTDLSGDSTIYTKITFKGDLAQTFKPNASITYPEIIFAKGGGSVTFDNNKLSVNKFTDNNTASNVDINFNSDCTIKDSFTYKNGKTTVSKTLQATFIDLDNAEISGSISTTGNQIYNGTVTLSPVDTVTLNATTNGDITFKNTITGNSKNLTISEAKSVSFENDITGLASLNIKGNSISLPANISTTGDQIYDGSVIVTAKTTINSKSNINLKKTVTGTGSLTIGDSNDQTNSPKSIIFSKNIGSSDSNLSSLSITADKITLPSSITTNGPQIYTGPTEFPTSTSPITIDAGDNGDIKFNNLITANNNSLTIHNAKSVNFVQNITNINNLLVEKTNTETTLPSSVTTIGSQTYNGKVSSNNSVSLSSTNNKAINLNNGCNITNGDFTIATTGNLSLKGTNTYLIKNGSLTHKDGTTTVESNIEAASIKLGKSSLKANLTTTDIVLGETSIDAQNVVITNTNDFTNKTTLTIKTNNTLEVTGSFINDTAGKISNNGTLILGKDFTNNNTYSGEGSITLNGTESQIFISNSNNNDKYKNIKITNSKGPITFNNKLSVDNISLSCPVVFNNGITINNDLTISKTNNNITISSGTGSQDTIDVKNLIIETGGKLSFGGTITAQNFSNNGTLNLTANTILKIKGDFTDNGSVTKTGSETISIYLLGLPELPKTTQTFTQKDSSTTIYDEIFINNKTSVPVNFKGNIKVKTFRDDTGYTGEINFNCPVTINDNLTLNTTKLVTFGNSSNDKIILGNESSSPASYIDFSRAKSTKIKGTLKAKILSLEQPTIEGIIVSTSVSLGSDTNAVIFNGTSPKVTTTSTQTYNGAVTLNSKSTTLNSGDSISFNKAISGSGKTLNIKASQGTINFSALVTLGKLDDTGNKASISFNKGGSISSDTTFSTPGKLTIYAPFNTTGSLIHTAGDTVLNSGIQDTISANEIELGTTSVKGIVSSTTSHSYGNLTLKGDTQLDGKTYSSEGIIGNFKLTITTKDKTSTATISNTIYIQSLQIGSSSVAFSNINLPGTVTTTGSTSASSDQSYYGPVTCNNETTFTAQSGNSNLITFYNGGKFNKDATTFVTIGTVTFHSTSTFGSSPSYYSFSNTGLTVLAKNATVNASTADLKDLTINKGATLKLSDSFINKGKLTNNGTFIINKHLTNNETFNIENNSLIQIGGNYTNKGNYTTKSSDTIELNGASTQTFTPNTTDKYGTINITNSGSNTNSVSFGTNQLQVNKINLQNSNNSNITFEKDITVSYISDTNTVGNITFNGKCNINSSSPITFNTTKTVQFGNSDKSSVANIGRSSSLQNLTHTAGPTKIYGDFNVSGLQLGETTLKGTINATTAALGYNGTNLSLEGNITTSVSQNYKGPIELTEALTLISKTGNITLEKAITSTSYALTIKGTNGKTITFKENANLSSLSDTDNKANIIFEKASTIKSETNLTTSGDVTFGTVGNVVYTTTIGDTTKQSFTHTNGNTTIIGNFNAANINLGTSVLSGKITSTETQTYGNTVSLSGNTILSSDSNINFNSTINSSNNPASLEILKSNNSIFTGNIGSTKALYTLSVKSSSITLPASVNTTDTQTYYGPILLVNNTTLLSPTNIIFKSIIDSKDTNNKSLSIARTISATDPQKIEKADSVSFDGSIGNTNKLTSLTVYANTITLPESINTVDTHSYNGTINLVKSSTNLSAVDSTDAKKNIAINGSIKSTNNTNLTLNSNLTSTGLVLNVSSGDIIINGTTSLASLSDNANNQYNIYFDNGGSITSTSDTTLFTKGTVTFNKKESPETTFSIGTSPNYANFTHTNGKTVIYDIFNAAHLTLGTTDIEGEINTDVLKFTKPLLLTGSTTLKANKSITFTEQATIDSISDTTVPLSLESKVISLNGNIGSNKKLTSLDVKASTSITLPQIVTTKENQIYSNTQLILPTSTDTSVTGTTITGASITIYDNINGNNKSLTISNSGTLNILDSEGPTSNTTSKVTKLQNFTQNGEGKVNLAGDITTTNDISFAKAISLSDDVSLIGINVSFTESINGSHNLYIGTDSNKSTNVTFSSTLGNTTPLTSLDVYSTVININNSITTNNAQNYHGPVALSTTNPISMESKTSDITFYNTVGTKDSELNIKTIAGQKVNFNDLVTLKTLTDTENAGNIILTKGGSTSTDIDFVTPGTVIINNTNEVTTFTTKALKHIKGLTIITDNLNTEDLTLGESTINGTIKSSSVSLGDTGVTPTTTTKSISLAGSITTTGAQTYQGPITLTGTTTLEVTDDGEIKFMNTVFGGSQNLKIYNNSQTEISKIVSFIKDFDIGQIDKPLKLLSINASSISLPNNVYVITQIYNGSLSSTSEDVTLSGDSITLFDNINQPNLNLTIELSETGILTFEDFIGIDNTKDSANLASFTQTGNGTVNISGDINATGDISFASPILLAGDVSLNGTNITSSSTIDNPHTLIIGNIKANKVTLNDNIGNTSNLISLSSIIIKATDTIILPSIINTTGSQSFDATNSVNLPKETTSLKGSDITLYDNILGDNILGKLSSLTITNSGELQFLDKNLPSGKDTSKSAQLANFTQNGTGTVSLSADISSANNISFDTAVTLMDDVLLNATKDIKFNSSIDGDKSFTITNSNNTEFVGNIGEHKPLTNISITSTVNTKLPAIINTTGSQTYIGNVNIETTTIKSTADGNIKFNNKLSGNTLNIYTTKKENSIIFVGAVELSALVDNFDNRLVNNGAITFGSTTNIASALELKTPNDVTIKGPFTVGASPLKNFTHKTGKTIINGTVNAADLTLAETELNSSTENIITTTGNQTYSSTVSINQPAQITIDSQVEKIPIIIFTQNASIIANADLTLAGYTLYQGGNITGTGSLSATSDKDFVIQPLASTSPAPSIESKISADRILIDNSKQNITITNILEASSDLAVFGSSYCTTDQESETPEIYTYNFTSPALPQPENSTYPLSKNKFTSYPTANSIVLDSGELSAGINFYINGVTVSGTGKFTLPDNYNTIARKAEAFYSDFFNSNITINKKEKKSEEPVKLVTEKCNLNTDQTFEKGWDSDTHYQFEIEDVHTIDDNVIYVKFNRPIRLISKGADGLNVNNGSRISYSASSYNDTIFTAGSTAGSFNQLTKTKETSTIVDLSEIYITAPETWNTDATGTFEGEGTDKSGAHKTSIPYIDIKRNVNGDKGYNYFITDLYGKRLKQYSGATVYNQNPEIDGNIALYDKCGPVLITVTNGQEFHTTDPDKLKSYDAHNFIEFRYSEPVYFGENPLLKPDFNSPTPSFENVQNITAGDAKFGTIENNNSGFNVAGLGTFTGGTIKTGQKNIEDLSINTFYRKDKFSIRLSIAGLTTGSESAMEWTGYIDSSKTIEPNGQVTDTHNKTVVKDKDDNILTYNNFFTEENSVDSIKYQNIKNEQLPITVARSYVSKPNGCSDDDFLTYGSWDLSAPTFARLNLPKNFQWTNDSSEYEILGFTAGSGTTVQRLEFHLFDNTPTYDNSKFGSEPVWYSSKGWFTGSTQTTTCADVFGGSKPFHKLTPEGNPSAETTKGGIRYHTINSNAFSYSLSTDTLTKGNFLNKHPKAESLFFLGFSASEGLNKNDIGELYFSLEMDNKNYPIETQFNVEYAPTVDTGYITDLAGNRMSVTDENHSMTTVDKTPPTFNILLSPIDQKEIFIVFSKHLETDMGDLTFFDTKTSTTPIPIEGTTFEESLPYSFTIVKIDPVSGELIYGDPDKPNIDVTVPAKVQTIKKNDGKDFTAITLTMDRELTYEDLKTYHIQLSPIKKKGMDGYITKSFDGINGIENSRVTFIRDEKGNFMQMYSAHAISDFGINILNPLYAHNSAIKNGEDSFMNGLYEDGSWAVHDWSRDQQNYGTLYGNEEAQIVVQLNENTAKSDTAPKGAMMYIDSSPDANSISTQINKDLNTKYRIWFPQIKQEDDYIFKAFAQTNNSQYESISSETQADESGDQSSRLLFNIDEETAKRLGTNQQNSFLFALTDKEITAEAPFEPVMIYNSLIPKSLNNDQLIYNLQKGIKTPIYCLRLEDPSDITSIDLWSYKTKSVTHQRGGVTILNNVINATNGEDTVINVQVPSDGNLSVMILTLDGNIVKYLQRGDISAGEYNYYWNGTNNNNTPVARGLYFVRVIGGGIDETRKVMVVR